MCVYTCLILSEKSPVSPWDTAVSRLQATAGYPWLHQGSVLTGTKAQRLLPRCSQKLQGVWAQLASWEGTPHVYKCLGSFFSSSSFLPSSSNAALGRQSQWGLGWAVPIPSQAGRHSPTVSRQDYMTTSHTGCPSTGEQNALCLWSSTSS